MEEFAGCRSAEDVHEQGVGTHGGVEFAPAAAGFRFGQCPALGVNLVESAEPIRVACDGGVGGVEEVAVAEVVGRVDDDGRVAVAFDMGAVAGPEAVPATKFAAQV